MEIPELASNLQAFLEAAHSRSGPSPSPFSTRTYAGGAQKALSDLLYSLYEKGAGSGLKKERLFGSAWETAWAVDFWTSRSLKKRELLEWRQWIGPLAKSSILAERVDRFFLERFSIRKFSERWSRICEKNRAVSKELKRRRLKELAPFPERALEKLCRSAPLSSSERTSLKGWISKIDEAKIPLKTFHGLLEAFLESGFGEIDASYLEWHLKEEGCRLFEEADEALSSLQKQTLKTSKLPLGPLRSLSLGPPLEGGSLFPLSREPGRFLLLGKNRVSLAMQEREMQAFPLESLKPAKTLLIDPKGRFKLIESSFPKLDEIGADELDCAALKLVRECVKKRFFPSGASFETLVYDREEKRLVSLTPWKIELFDYAKLEALAWRLARQELKSFSFLMELSSLSKQPEALFLEEVSKKAILRGISREEIAALADRRGVAERRCRLRAEEIAQEIELLIARLKPLSEEKSLRKNLLTWHLYSSKRWALWPKLEDKVRSLLA